MAPSLPVVDGPRQGVELLDLEQAPPHLRPQLRLGHVGAIARFVRRITLTRIMREGVVLGETQEPPCGTNVVYRNV